MSIWLDCMDAADVFDACLGHFNNLSLAGLQGKAAQEQPSMLVKMLEIGGYSSF